MKCTWPTQALMPSKRGIQGCHFSYFGRISYFLRKNVISIKNQMTVYQILFFGFKLSITSQDLRVHIGVYWEPAEK